MKAWTLDDTTHRTSEPNMSTRPDSTTASLFLLSLECLATYLSQYNNKKTMFVTGSKIP